MIVVKRSVIGPPRWCEVRLNSRVVAPGWPEADAIFLLSVSAVH